MSSKDELITLDQVLLVQSILCANGAFSLIGRKCGKEEFGRYERPILTYWQETHPFVTRTPNTPSLSSLKDVITCNGDSLSCSLSMRCGSIRCELMSVQ